MANTKLVTKVYGGTTSKYLWLIYRLISDGSQETAAVVYDNDVDGPSVVTRGTVMEIMSSGKSASGMLRLEWDQSTKSPIASLTPAYNCDLDFCEFGGIPNPGAAGATGDILL